MKLSYAKFYVGARVAAVVQTYINPTDNKKINSMEATEYGVLIDTTYSDTENRTKDETVLIPWPNVAYCYVKPPEPKPALELKKKA